MNHAEAEQLHRGETGNSNEHKEAIMSDTQNKWNMLYKIGGAAAIGSVLLIPIQIAIFMICPPPTAIPDWFALFQENWLLGLLSLDLLYLLNNTFVLLIYLALYISLKEVNPSLMTVAFLLCVVGATVYFASNTGFEMLTLSKLYAIAETGAEKAVVLASARTMLTIYTGTAFNSYYMLNGIGLLLMSVVMRKSAVFGKATAVWGLAAALFMSIPSTAGTIGLVFSLLSLIPWIVFCILVARRLFWFSS